LRGPDWWAPLKLGSTPRNYPASDVSAMSLYYEAAAILANTDKAGGSLKSRIYTKKDLKSTPGQIFALIAEASKWSIVLKDVIEKCGLLSEERKV
jgi:putative methyltransferase